MTAETIRRWRNTRPATREGLWQWVYAFTGVKIARKAVCCGHHAPFDAFAAGVLDRPPVMLEHGSRGSGKSFMGGLSLHVTSRFHSGHKARILGGSKDQSRQIYEALTTHVRDGRGAGGSDGGPDVIESLLVERARYVNRAEVSILAASVHSVRGPHVPTLRLDEVDEIADEYFQSAMGMNMAIGGLPASLQMTSTCHRPAGPMAALIDRARKGEFPLWTYCAFEVLEHCPESRSGPGLENCPACPIRRWCHEDRDRAIEAGVETLPPPKAKISDGHYAIDSLIQKVKTTSLRVFEADYLCKRPKADGVWFPDFDPAVHVDRSADFDPALPVHRAIDSGVFTGAVWFQIREVGDRHRVTVFGDYLSEGSSAESNARSIVEQTRELCRDPDGRIRCVTSTDPAGNARNSIGPTVVAEYKRAGIYPLDHWPITPVSDSLALLESFIRDAAGEPWLVVHPRCRHLIEAMQAYRRAKRQGQWIDRPEDPQHPYEDVIDALRGGLCHKWPQGRKGEFRGRKVGVGAAVN